MGLNINNINNIQQPDYKWELSTKALGAKNVYTPVVETYSATSTLEYQAGKGPCHVLTPGRGFNIAGRIMDYGA